MSLGKKLKYERIKRGMTQAEFGKFLDVNRASIAHYERDRTPAPARIKIFSERLGVDLAEIITNEVDGENPGNGENEC